MPDAHIALRAFPCLSAKLRPCRPLPCEKPGLERFQGDGGVSPIPSCVAAAKRDALVANIAYGYVRKEEGVDRAFLEAGDYALEVACEKIPCRIRFGALYDPEMARIKL